MKYQSFSIKYQVSGIKFLFLLLATCYLFLFVSCHKEVPIPAYIHIDNINLTVNPNGTQGSNTQKIVDSWIDIDGTLIGAFEMPFTIPALYSGQHTITIFPGIKDNGMNETRVEYPFYSTYTQTVILTQGNILKINPTVTYAASTNFSFIQDFESGSGKYWLNDTSKSISDTSMQIVTGSVVAYGNQCGGVVLKTVNSIYAGSTYAKYHLQSTPPIYLEMDYNCNTPFSVGVNAYDGTTATSTYLGQQIVMTLRPTTGWNKIYVNLSSAVIGLNSAAYSIYFTMQCINPPSYFYLDNVKLIY